MTPAVGDGGQGRDVRSVVDEVGDFQPNRGNTALGRVCTELHIDLAGPDGGVL
ncbi:hypothetical protein DFQ14_11062 [Halopolyspora algeriensis]|uniref:Uncharacterized protein n=1 Tax=Halopolyspora algeriensis TaxID=1500506 RepID=A0A368VM27_9ACTN|nr:hypothetical protein DFQ14_11062 [Halopolyspora algeriensis]TQM53345.1 hypothetical protein FHU43_2737 [Halopolyspora algeriensis]